MTAFRDFLKFSFSVYFVPYIKMKHSNINLCLSNIQSRNFFEIFLENWNLLRNWNPQVSEKQKINKFTIFFRIIIFAPRRNRLESTAASNIQCNKKCFTCLFPSSCRQILSKKLFLKKQQNVTQHRRSHLIFNVMRMILAAHHSQIVFLNTKIRFHLMIIIGLHLMM